MDKAGEVRIADVDMSKEGYERLKNWVNHQDGIKFWIMISKKIDECLVNACMPYSLSVPVENTRAYRDDCASRKMAFDEVLDLVEEIRELEKEEK